MPRDIATREIFNVCVNEGLSVEADRQCVYLDLTHIPRAELDRKLGGILEIYEKFQGVDPRDVPMKIFPAVHYSMGGLWVDYERTRRRRPAARLAAQSADEHPRPVRHRRVRLPVPRRQPPGRQLAAVLHLQRPDRGAGHREAGSKSLKDSASDDKYDQLLARPARASSSSSTTNCCKRTGGGENPYLLHQELGDVMTKAATVVRHNDQLRDAIEKVNELAERVEHCSLSDTGNWTNQNVVFTKALRDMFPLAKAILQRRPGPRRMPRRPLQAGRSTCPASTPTDPAEKRRQAEAWCDEFEAKNRQVAQDARSPRSTPRASRR